MRLNPKKDLWDPFEGCHGAGPIPWYTTLDPRYSEISKLTKHNYDYTQINQQEKTKPEMKEISKLVK